MQSIPIITCGFSDKTSLHWAYMPFVRQGGLFISTETSYPMGSQVQLVINLMEEGEPYVVLGQVIWITPFGAQANKPAGVGLQFLDDPGQKLRNTIEMYLADMINSSQPTHTL